MEKTDPWEMATREKVLERPPLFVAMLVNPLRDTDGVFLYQNGTKVMVKSATGEDISPLRNYVGYKSNYPPQGPQYTGPIDDEMMANILIYGG